MSPYDRLALADMLVHLEKRASVGAGIGTGLEAGVRGLGGVLRGTQTVGSAALRAGAGEAEKILGGKALGRAIGLGIRAAPYVGGAYLVNRLLGDPVGQIARSKLQQFRLQQAMQRSSFDPRSGVMY